MNNPGAGIMRLISMILTGIQMLILLLGFTTLQAASVTIDGAIEYQEIDGFGGNEVQLFPKTDNDFNLIFNELGASILDMGLYTQTEDTVYNDTGLGDASRNDNDDPDIIDWNGVDTSWIDMIGRVLPVKAQAHGCNIFAGKVCSPPSWMRSPAGLFYRDGKLLAQNYDEFAEFLYIWYKGLKDRKGVTLSYIGLQNEPNGGHNPTWTGCTYTGAELRDLIKVVGPYFQTKGITAKIILPECVSLGSFAGLANPTLQDPIARQYVGVLATHPYNVTFSNPDGAITAWTNVADIAGQYNLKLWQNEWGAGNTSWKDGLLYVQHMHNGLYYGKVSAWLYMDLYHPTSFGDGYGGLVNENGPREQFYWVKHYFRYVRPGAVRIQAATDNGNILVTSFVQKDSKTIAIVNINRGGSNQNVNFTVNNIQGLSSLNAIRSSATENAVNLGQISVTGNSFSYTLPDSSITTLTGTIGTTTNEMGRKKDNPIEIIVSPNPFNPKTIIEVRSQGSAGHLAVNIYDIKGALVNTLAPCYGTHSSDRPGRDGQNTAGAIRYIWDASSWQTGLYIVKIIAGDKIMARKITLLK
ncbi:MAG: hypothetical protein A2268_13585 [Candidatus Raymondbacteria bacterium RifOxyA12_full_50_37]|uniref:Endo-beta-1,6-galactanase-like domain-containing protein n=1 Tax=Candidatus Raymondbacteria bacterium RIFOXYD12_FULL_49_13 TaxID=1817890 RepID=A0A1F7F8X3_UNCRA|nr:MAG: hypothetical protein A2350_08205 [Candidatus Raymondbacteria bacterium RifOxyB12_full_50_8]OGJ90419.1 MAG: hypothetical protein A2268_13585 [Candidatus Raymondbacteria bacterium RifOxyA12_full_50_37]OGJ91499.1 MAG: hypothetical protein A2248_03610 [Candidatus Raymondbacteria bacterium RIFOXYA2_FULL_49_16]OGJ97813.1 MAG: hypothetical protein A2453_13995 [Candidatus Raymondbacteria bacterium RIFOXYC2_FULL_50_21]OGK01978.1 MAG: hypothetical protein A2487_11085 [Candidatus Raymondbacteria b